MAEQKPIVIIGAGVIGLSTACLLQTKLQNSTIYIIAEEFPGDISPSADYASMWAGAHYRPIPGSTEQLKYESQLAWKTADVMKKIAAESPEAGVAVMPGIEFLEDPPEENISLKTGDVYAGLDDGFRLIDANELPLGVKWGCEYTSWCLNVPMYCSWLLTQFVNNGGRKIRRRLNRSENAFEIAREEGIAHVSTVVNCSGRNFDLDPATKIIRGQTVLVKNEYNRTITRQNKDGSWVFLIPRPQHGGTIVGGSKEIGDTEVKARPETTRRLLEQSVAAFPDFVKSVDRFEIVKINVGRRPWREGGLRLEIELLEKGRRIVHGYGAGGRGFELSWGIAQRLVELVEERGTDVDLPSVEAVL